MGEIHQDPKKVLLDVFKNYDTNGKGELTPIQVQILHGDLRMGGISLPQVIFYVDVFVSIILLS